MAIGTNSAIDFWGTESELTVASPGAVAASGFSVAGDVADWTNVDDAPTAMFKLRLSAAGLSASPTAGEVINMYCRHKAIEGAEDSPVPDANYRATYLGSFVLDAADADQVHVIGPIRLPNYITQQTYEFFIENAMASANIAADGWQLWITPITTGPHG